MRVVLVRRDHRARRLIDIIATRRAVGRRRRRRATDDRVSRRPTRALGGGGGGGPNRTRVEQNKHFHVIPFNERPIPAAAVRAAGNLLFPKTQFTGTYYRPDVVGATGDIIIIV